ncbi:rod shape-determining protein MreC [Flavilitoribacter nigricans]|uniref:Cell shape-determining protein MreC n=1 Tax=Flavilitoribacter nigricans (strain ATCC 23147 / DSM 23189 / NBRC 102662 / NCIMB 1420 / SS-2) TaxID=1122177 RepID=A0A2D0N3G2_FLAN2|nr:rod shape-determining protein MreC [Flavilitoribacter nigricans]PHN03061.1 rod shape-determining protein MreC [Flavilitoribacter nigricans DSM 23189 = NBRC 102662]
MTTFKRVRRFGSWVTFLVLEAISLTLVVEYNQYQNQIFAHSANVVTGTLNDQKSGVFQFLSLTNENERLQEENARLRKALSAMQATVATPDSSARFPDSLRQRYEFLPTKVINKTLLGQNNYFTIDRGTRDSVVRHMGVIGDQGLIGIITNVSRHYAKVMTILHPQTRISASIKGQSYYGSLLWEGRNPNIMTLEDIPKIVDVSQGDTIITSGYSNIFPPNIVIGTVENSELKPGDGGRTISVRLINDLSSLTYAYVIRDRMASDLKKLEE